MPYSLFCIILSISHHIHFTYTFTCSVLSPTVIIILFIAVKTILIIERDSSFRKLLSDWIKMEGFNPLIAEDAATGLMAAKQHQPNVVICTDKDSEFDSISILKTLRNDPNTAEIPCFLLTSEVDVDHFFTALNAGATGFLKRSPNWQDLQQSLKAKVLESVTANSI